MSARWGILLTSIVLLLGSVVVRGAEPSAEEERLAMPDDEQLAAATKTVRDVFAAEFKAANTLAKKQELADKLMGEALKTTDDLAGQCALFREARTLAVAAGDVKLSLKALDEMGRVFKFDDLTVRAKTLLALGETGNKGATSPDLAAAANELFEDAIRADNFDLAKQLGQLTGTVALKSKDLQLAQRANKRMKDLEALGAAFAKHQAALETLQNNADDAEANLTVGKYLCFNKGDWENGLRNLVKGGDADLKMLANQELGEPTDATDQVNLGDAWWDRGDEESAIAKPILLARAVFWYEQALPALTGLAKAKTEKRLAEYNSSDSGPTAKAPPSRWIRLLPMVNLKRDSVRGKWERVKDAIATKSSSAILQLPYQPPAEYDLRYSFTRLKGRGGVAAAFQVAKKQLSFGMGWYDDNSHAGYEYFNNKALKQGPFAIPFSLENNKKYEVLLHVRKDGVQAAVDGKPLINCKTDGSDITVNRNFTSVKSGTIAVFTKDDAIFYNIDIRDVTGRGMILK